MNQYGDYAKSEIREFFYEDMPKFPFKVSIKPMTELSVVTRRILMRICRRLRKICLYERIEEFLHNVSEDPDHESLNQFEKEIVGCEGFKTLLLIHDMRFNIYERSIRMHAWEYLRQENLMNNENYDDFIDVIFVPTINSKKDELFELLYGSRHEEVMPYIELIYYSFLHKVVVVKKDGEHLILPLEQILTYDYGDFDVHERHREALQQQRQQKLKLPNDAEKIRSTVQLIGLKSVILPELVYESKTKC